MTGEKLELNEGEKIEISKEQAQVYLADYAKIKNHWDAIMTTGREFILKEQVVDPNAQ